MADLQPNNTRDVFFSPKNEVLLERLLTTDMQRRIGGELSEKQKSRLSKTVDHYMEEVYTAEPNRGKSVQQLNKEVLQAVVPDYLSYLRRQTQPRPETDAEMDRIRMDVSSRFDMMQQARQGDRAAIPDAPNFQLALEDSDAPPAMSLFEEAKRQRELEAKRMEEAAAASNARPLPEDMQRQIASDDLFRSSARLANQADMSQLAVRNAGRLATLEDTKNRIMDVPPDPRQILLGEGAQQLHLARGPRSLGIPNANPTLALPDAVRTRPPLPQDNIKSQEDVITYKENEYNLFIYSADRDWVNNNAENRYNFSVNFDPANNRSGFGLSPSTYIKFKNISRIELVKVIMATEACDTLSLKTSATAYDTSKYVNVFAYPYLQVHIDELNTNGYGTNDGLNNSFGIISYDAYWASDSNLFNRGYARMIPKFLKCQKVFYPTPLATLNKMTIQLQKPDGSLVCDSADTFDISGVFDSSGAKALLDAGYANVTTYYRDTSGEYLFLQTKSWFNEFSVSQGDRILLKNVTLPSSFSVNTQANVDFLAFLNRAEGHIVVDTGQYYITPAAQVYLATGTNGATRANKLGYSNIIVIRNKFADPTTGSISIATFGGTAALRNAFLKQLDTTPTVASGRALNLSHQIQIIFRVITRDMDSATRIRPDNL